MLIQLVYAFDQLTGLFGIGSRLPWSHCKEDMQHFVKVTKNTTVVMGRKTFESIPVSLKSHNRRVAVISSNPNLTHPKTGERPDAVYSSFDAMRLGEYNRSGVVSVIGGIRVLMDALPHAAKIIRTRVRFKLDVKPDTDNPDAIFIPEQLKTLSSSILVDTTDIRGFEHPQIISLHIDEYYRETYDQYL